MFFWLAQVFFVCAFISYFFAVSSKIKRQVVMWFMITNVFFSLHYLCLEKYSTLLLLTNEIVLLLVLFLLEKYNKPHKYTILTCFIILCCHIVVIVLTWTETISLLPLSASIVFLFCLLFKGVLITKICSLYTNLAYIIYLSLIHSYVAIICQSVLLILATYGLIVTLKDIKTRKTIQNSRTVEATILKNIKIEPAHTKEELVLTNK